MRLRRIADRVRAGVDHAQQHALIEARAADQEVVGGPLAALVLAPRFAQPCAVGFEAACRQHAAACLEALRAAARGHEARAVELDRVDRRVVADLHAERFGAAVIGVHERLAAAHEEGVGARDVQRAGQRRLKAHAMRLHPRTTGRRRADHEPRQRLVGDAAGHLQQVLPVFLFGIGADQHVLRRVVHAAQIAGVLRVAAAPFARGRFEQQHRSACFARHQRGAERGIAAADHEYVDHLSCLL
jgi:hypothetical protein